MKGFHLNLYKHRGTSAAPPDATSRRFNGIIVADILIGQFDLDTRTTRYRYVPVFMEGMRVHTYNPDDDALMVLIQQTRAGEEQWELHDAKLVNGELLFTAEGMCSGAIGDATDSRWSRIVDAPVRLFDRHEWAPTFQAPDGVIR